MPPVGIEEPFAMFEAPEGAIVCTRNWLWCINVATGRVIRKSALAIPSERCVEMFSCRTAYGASLVRLTTAAQASDRLVNYRISTYSLAGVEVASVSIDVPMKRFFRHESLRTVGAVLGASDDIGFVLVDSASNELRVHAISPYSPDMLLYLSQNGDTFATASPTQLAFWTGDNPVPRVFKCDGSWYNVMVTNDGTFAVITYCTDKASPDIAVVLNIQKGELSGRCSGHLCGSLPFAFSASNKYFASVITDSTTGYHPSNLASGSVVLTRLPKR
jgi:hypothetical protein